MYSYKNFEWREKRLNINNGLLIGVKSGFVVNGVKGRLNHFMESSYEENKFTLKTSIGISRLLIMKECTLMGN